MPDKLPAFQFYPGDWRKDVGVQSLSYRDRGIWFEMICLMHCADARGKLMCNGKAMTDDQIARSLGLDNQTFKQTLTTLLETGVAGRDPDTQAIVNRRMVRDEEIRKVRAECGKRGGNPALLNQKPTTKDNQKPTPSSSVSISSSEVNTPKPPQGDLVLINVPPEESKEEKVLRHLNLVANRDYRPIPNHLNPIRLRLSEVRMDDEGVCKMITRQASMWCGTEMDNCMAPSILFRKSKFHSYYDDRNRSVSVGRHQANPKQALEERIKSHPANPSSIKYFEDVVTDAQRQELATLRKELEALR